MKPCYLRMENIGPFKSQSIDFTQLGDMFLICGKTGAGKTTIFDAITYCLYGKLPGSRSGLPNRQLRSDFAPPEEDALVEFTFSLHQKLYKITRTLPKQCKKKNGSMGEKPETVTLCRKEEQDFVIQPGSVTETNKYILELIGLSAEEFSRIILLPQGAFAEFLTQNSKERGETLAKLFPVDQWERLTEKIKTMKNQKSAALQTIQQQLEQYGEDYNPLAEEEKITEQETFLKGIHTLLDELKQKQLQLTTEQEQYRQLQEKYLKKQSLQEKLHQLEQNRETYNSQKAELEAALQAEPAAEALRQLQEKEQALAILQEDIHNTQARKQTTEKQVNELLAQKPDIAILTEKKEVVLLLRHDVQRGIAQEKNILSLEQQLKEICREKENIGGDIQKIKKELEKTEEELKNNPAPDFSELENLQSQLNAEKEKTEEAKKIFQEAQEYALLQKEIQAQEEQAHKAEQEARKAKQALEAAKEREKSYLKENYARMLAVGLKENTPCPVCGALHHPNLADSQLSLLSVQDDAHTLQEDIKRLEETESRLQTAWAQCNGVVTQLKNQAEKYSQYPNPEEAEAQYKIQLQQTTETERHCTETTEAIKTNSRLLTEKTELQNRLQPLQEKNLRLEKDKDVVANQLEQEKKSLQETLQKAATQGYSEASPTTLFSALNFWLKDTEETIARYDKDCQERQKELSSIQAKLQEQLNTQTLRETEVHDALQHSTEVLKNKNFPHKEAVEKAYRTPGTIVTLQRATQQWLTDYTQTQAMVQDLEQDTQESPEQVREQWESIKSRLAETEQALSETEEKKLTATTEVQTARQALEQWKKLETQRRQYGEEEKLYSQLYTDISINNPKKVALTTWILGIYLQEITTYASRRLFQLSEGRYTLLMNEEKTGGNGAKGLDLEILDAYTGKKRPCNTLSGGETFMASISLALALTDVVSNRSGGISLDALFIDEGFGSLDTAALDKAISVLEEIRGSRCIGLISHVAELQSRIPIRLEVRKTATGSTAEVM